MRVVWTDEALARLREIEHWIETDSPMAAKGVIKRLIRRSQELENLPQLGRKVPEFQDQELLDRPFRIIYRIGETQIEILTVMHYRQLLPGTLPE